MENINNIHKEIEKNAPFLSKMKKENHFLTPNNYFKVIPEITSDKELINKSFNISFDNLSWRFLIPISSFSVILILFLYFNNSNSEIPLSNEQLSEYIINNNYIAIDDYLVFEAYAEIIEKNKDMNDDTDEYIDYLIENNIDISSIMDEL